MLTDIGALISEDFNCHFVRQRLCDTCTQCENAPLELRKQLVYEIINRLQSLPKLSKTIFLCSFGSGFLGMEYVIIKWILQLELCSNIEIFLIDNMYRVVRDNKIQQPFLPWISQRTCHYRSIPATKRTLVAFEHKNFYENINRSAHLDIGKNLFYVMSKLKKLANGIQLNTYFSSSATRYIETVFDKPQEHLHILLNIDTPPDAQPTFELINNMAQLNINRMITATLINGSIAISGNLLGSYFMK